MSKKIYDDAYKTLTVNYTKLMIPVINDQFGTDYAYDEEIIPVTNELPKEDGEIVADSIFKIRNMFYHIECQSKEDGTMVIRMLEYDFYIALREYNNGNGVFNIEFPKSAVIYLRHTRNTPDVLKIDVKVSETEHFTYAVPVIKLQDYSLDEIFDKKMYIFLPFYLLRYEKVKKELEADEKIRNEAQQECEEIVNRLDLIYGIATENEKLIIQEVLAQMKKVVDFLFKNQKKIRDQIGGTIMGGEVLKTQAQIQEELKAEIATKEATIKDKEATIKDKEATIKDVKEKLAEKDAEIARLHAIIESGNK